MTDKSFVNYEVIVQRFTSPSSVVQSRLRPTDYRLGKDLINWGGYMLAHKGCFLEEPNELTGYQKGCDLKIRHEIPPM